MDQYDMLIEDLKKDKDRKSGSRKFWSFPSNEEGTKKIRILPQMVKNGEKFFYIRYAAHWIDGKSYLCLNQDVGGHRTTNCPICNTVKKLYKTAERDSADWKLAGDLRAKERYVSRIIVRGSDDETIPVFYEYGKTIYDMLYNVIALSDFGNITHPTKGRDYNLTKTGTGRNCKYSSSTPSARETPIFEDTAKLRSALENAQAMDYNELLNFSSFDEMQEALDTFLNGGETPAHEEVKVPAHEYKSQTVSIGTKTSSLPKVEEAASNDDLDDLMKEFEL